MARQGPESVSDKRLDATVAADLSRQEVGNAPAAATPSRGWSPRALYTRRRSAANTVVSILIAMGIWEIASYHVSALVLVPLQAVWKAFLGGIRDGSLGVDVWATTEAFLLAFILSSAVGVVVGLIMATSDIANELMDPWVSALYATPLIAIAPLFVAIFGLGLSAKVSVAFLLAVLPVIINTSAGIRTVERSYIEGAYSFGASRLQIFYKVLIPAAVPFIITGLRLAVGRSLIGVVVAEFFGSQHGLGHRVFMSAQIFDTGNVFVGMFILMGMGVTLFKFMYWLEKKIAPWRTFNVP